MHVIARDGAHEIEISRSRFRCSLARVPDLDAAAAFVAGVRAQDPSATHHCSAIRVGPDGQARRCADDGEPAGTAGVPMLEVLLHRDLTDVVAVVSRWFGGTRLGAGGLVRAYGRAVSETLDRVGTLRRVHHRELLLAAPHDRAGRLENALREAGHRVREVHHGTDVTITVLVPEDAVDGFDAWLGDQTAGETEALDVGRRDLYLP